MPEHKLTIMSQRGDDETKWNPDNPDQVAIAAAVYDDLVRLKKFIPIDVDKEEKLSAFDPNVRETLMLAPLVGG